MSDKNGVAIRIQNVSKDFYLPHEQNNSLKTAILNIFKQKNTEGNTQHVLKDVSFDVKKGEFLGIVGRNGSGKSTLLKILAEIYTPTSGSVEVNGRLVPFIELGVGFNPELTGRENVYLNGALLGFSQKEMEEKYDDIVAFAELEEFMDQKLKNYSSGMQVRLAFSVAIQADGDILVLDEVLAVGDEAFQRKCYRYFADLKKANKTVILVTHSMDTVQQFCTRAILIDKEHEVVSGTPTKVSQIYRQLNEDAEEIDEAVNSVSSTKYVDATVETEVRDDKIIITTRLDQKQAMDDPIVAIGLYKSTGEQIYRWTSDEKLDYDVDLSKHKKIQVVIDDILPVGDFTTSLYIKKRDRSVDYGVFDDISRFSIKNTSKYEHATFWKIHDVARVNEEDFHVHGR